MKYFFPLAILTFMSLTSMSQLNIMSYNIRYDNPKDGENWWEFRKTEVVELLNYYHPDFIGIQESIPDQSNFIDQKLKSHKYIGHGRDGVNTNSEGIPLFYNTIKYKLLDSKVLWLSETPNKASKGWDANKKRIVVYGAFQNKKTKEKWYIFNCHFDHKGRVARKESAKLLLKLIKDYKLENEKVIVMGDLNCLPSRTPIKILNQSLEDSFNRKKHPVYGPLGTLNQFDTKRVLTERIDYIFTKNITVKSYRNIDDRRRNNLYPSDHLPILIKI